MKLKNSETPKNKKKGCKIALIVLGCIAALIVLAIVLIPKLLFTDYEGLPTTGPYGVKQVSAILVDESRVEAFEDDGSYREVPVYFYYPDVTTVSENETGETMGTADSQVNSFPLVIFSHGAFGYYQSNTSTYMELASNGYVVISLDHPYHSFFTKDTDGKTIIVDTEFMQQVMYINESGTAEDEIIKLSHEWLKLRMDDMSFALDSVKQMVAELSATDKTGTESLSSETDLPSYWYVSDAEDIQEILEVLTMTDTEHIGLMGHSLGGATSVTLGRTRDDIDAVIDLDGTMLGEEFGYADGKYELYEEAYPVPMLVVNNEEHHFQAEDVETLYVNRVVLANAVDAKYTYFKGSGHMNFTDLPLFSPALANMLGVGEADAEECVLKMNQLILEFYNCYLKDMGEVTVKESY